MDLWNFEVEPNNIYILREYITVMHTCPHYYTGETMRYIRRDYVAFKQSHSEYEFINEAQWDALLKRRIR